MRFKLLDEHLAQPPLERERIGLARARAFLELLKRHARSAAREVPGEFGPSTERLFDLVSASDLLAVVAPRGRIGRAFASACLREATRLETTLRAEEGAFRAAERLLRGGKERRPDARSIRSLARLAATYSGQAEEGLRPGTLAIPGTPWLVSARGGLSRRATIPGSRIALGPLDPRAERRLGRALALVDGAWPEAGAEIRARTRLVLTLEEPGLVSYSQPDRPGVTTVNLRGKRIVDLADDLLHESAHHRLHAIEQTVALLRPSKPGAGEIRYWSPWRRAMRPVRGILHAAYTFAFRAELLRRIEKGPKKVPQPTRRWLRSEAARERRHVVRAVRDLEDALRRGLLTPAARRLVRAIAQAAKSQTSG